MTLESGRAVMRRMAAMAIGVAAVTPGLAQLPNSVPAGSPLGPADPQLQAEADAAARAQRLAQQRAAEQARARFQAAFAPQAQTAPADPGRDRPLGGSFGQDAVTSRPAISPYRGFPAITTPWAPR